MENLVYINVIAFVAFLSFLTIFKADFEIGTIYQDTYRSAEIIATYDKMGLKMCGRFCRRHQPCTAINYNPQTLVCELLKSGGTSTANATLIYSDIGTWNMNDDACNSNPCPSTGKCMITVSGGHFCQNTGCTGNPCKNSGTCVVVSDTSYSCICQEGFSGVNCEITPCTSQPCLHSGTCVISGSSFQCNCAVGFSGTICQTTPCSSSPCYNKGTCSIAGSSYSCSCPAGYYGTRCENTPCTGVYCILSWCFIQGSGFYCGWA